MVACLRAPQSFDLIASAMIQSGGFSLERREKGEEKKWSGIVATEMQSRRVFSRQAKRANRYRFARLIEEAGATRDGYLVARALSNRVSKGDDTLYRVIQMADRDAAVFLSAVNLNKQDGEGGAGSADIYTGLRASKLERSRSRFIDALLARVIRWKKRITALDRCVFQPRA